MLITSFIGSTLPSFSQTTTPLTQPLLAQQSSLLAPKKQGLDTSTIPNPAHSASLKKTLYRTVNSEVPPPATSRYRYELNYTYIDVMIACLMREIVVVNL